MIKSCFGKSYIDAAWIWNQPSNPMSKQTASKIFANKTRQNKKKDKIMTRSVTGATQSCENFHVKFLSNFFSVSSCLIIKHLLLVNHFNEAISCNHMQTLPSYYKAIFVIVRLMLHLFAKKENILLGAQDLILIRQNSISWTRRPTKLL